MGVTIKAELSYGYRLKIDGDWLVHEVHPDDSDAWGLNLDWLNNEDSFEDEAVTRLLAATGFTETDWRADGYYDRLRAAEAQLAVKFGWTGWNSETLLLITKQHGADIGKAEEIDPAVLAEEAGSESDAQLRRALAVLGLTPLQEKPAWLLTAYRG